jgi:hypothetical protein
MRREHDPDTDSRRERRCRPGSARRVNTPATGESDAQNHDEVPHEKQVNVSHGPALLVRLGPVSAVVNSWYIAKGMWSRT